MYIENHLTFAREQLGTERGYSYNDEKTDTFLLMPSTALASTVSSPASYFSAGDVIDTIDISGRIKKNVHGSKPAVNGDAGSAGIGDDVI